MISKIENLRKNLFSMAELCLEEVMLLHDALETDDASLARAIIKKDDLIDYLEKLNDNLSQNAILEAFSSPASLESWKVNNEKEIRDPLRFALSAIRITRNFERIGDQVVNCANSIKNNIIPKDLFIKEEILSLIISRATTLMGMAVETLVEEKTRFYGRVNQVEEELNDLCDEAFKKYVVDERLNKMQFADLYRIILSLERIGDYSINIAEELVRLNTGRDIRHTNHNQMIENSET